MKAFIYYIGIVLFCTACQQSFAQKDSSKTKSEKPAEGSIVNDQEAPMLKHDIPFTAENSVTIEPAQVSPDLRKTLQDKQYAGWESGTLVRNIQTGEYKLEIVLPAKKTFYFTRNGEQRDIP